MDRLRPRGNAVAVTGTGANTCERATLDAIQVAANDMTIRACVKKRAFPQSRKSCHVKPPEAVYTTLPTITIIKLQFAVVNEKITAFAISADFIPVMFP